MEKNAKIYVAGHRGLAGSAIVRKLQSEGYTNIIVRSHAELDLCNQSRTNDFFASEKPDYVFLAAARVGGIGANSILPAPFIYENTMIGFNVVEAARKNGVKKLLNLGSSCIYPKFAPQPLKEEYLLTGALEPTNDAYALAKIGVIKLCAKYNSQYGTNFLSLMPTNLYGPGDNYNIETSHVLPALIAKFHNAKASGTDSVCLWGDGSPEREFLYSEDLADAALYLMQHYSACDIGEFINVGSGTDLSIKELAEIVRSAVYADTKGRSCKIEWDTSKPNGTPKKLLDVSRLSALGWKAKTPLRTGIALTYKHFLSEHI
ncbi:GDP-L-fucose synthase [Treponema sp. OMZ 840]|uniref:GDP-L-fucose synthase family protein n=1 Tax=Treponema sp. OMZ 840 TaxID=244313 RepID=UPI003D8BD5BD